MQKIKDMKKQTKIIIGVVAVVAISLIAAGGAYGYNQFAIYTAQQELNTQYKAQAQILQDKQDELATLIADNTKTVNELEYLNADEKQQVIDTLKVDAPIVVIMTTVDTTNYTDADVAEMTAQIDTVQKHLDTLQGEESPFTTKLAETQKTALTNIVNSKSGELQNQYSEDHQKHVAEQKKIVTDLIAAGKYDEAWSNMNIVSEAYANADQWTRNNMPATPSGTGTYNGGTVTSNDDNGTGGGGTTQGGGGAGPVCRIEIRVKTETITLPNGETATSNIEYPVKVCN
ncbi:hypothetical protein [Culicoidibacter larvae]|uniref:Uncharacterized protein n=1 Tax=Culicoidibacter larvae TaxID=2579976 RepID=A0A5R8Q775_9FIRM|nr:hypothetical protein [Culicoidibacter larvae]TLG71270.1 hypothetical protein FEZ08_11005 [Culicoidibacter larvae]